MNNSELDLSAREHDELLALFKTLDAPADSEDQLRAIDPQAYTKSGW
jgi:hypothetical protein